MTHIAGRTKRRWISSAIRHPGALHRALGIPEGRDIPEATLRAAAAGRYGPKNARRARLALTLRKIRS
jgi:hypothetical protein